MKTSLQCPELGRQPSHFGVFWGRRQGAAMGPLVCQLLQEKRGEGRHGATVGTEPSCCALSSAAHPRLLAMLRTGKRAELRGLGLTEPWRVG